MARLKTTSGVAVAVATVSLLATGLGTAASAPHARGVLASTPTLKVTIAHGKLRLHGPTTFQAGRVNLSLTVKGKDSETQVVRFDAGYGFKKYIRDFQTYAKGQGKNGESKAGLKALNHLAHSTKFFGGLDAAHGATATGSIYLPRGGTYVIYNDSQGSDPHKLKVTGPAVKRATPKSSGVVRATSAKRFRNTATGAAHGTLVFKNISSGKGASPHFLVLQHVKKGTTRKQVETALMADSNAPPPPFILDGSAETDVIGPGQSMTLDTNLPKGEYVTLCFFPDLQTGIPHAFMGMIGMIRLK
jgi:hypothetical protein